MRADARGVVVSVAIGITASGCGGSSSPAAPSPSGAPVDCSAPLGVDFYVDMSGEEIPTGESRLAVVRPGIAYPCAERVASVEWSLEGPAVARISALPGVDSSATGRAWLTGLARGSATVRARAVLRDGSARAARPATVRVGDGSAPSGGRVVVDAAVTITADSGLTVPSTPEMPLVLPLSGRVEIVVDWDSAETAGVRFPLREGVWNPASPGRVVIDSLTPGARPQRALAEYLPAGEYSFQIVALVKLGTTDTMRYQVRMSQR
jgi:hypothetical protein